jgi:hypothetical protein
VGPTKIASFSVVNALGVVLNRQGQVVRGNCDPQTGAPIRARNWSAAWLTGEPVAPPFGNRTLTMIVTNQKLDKVNLN